MIEIPCVIRELTDAEAFAVMAAENLEREDVDPVDEALFIREYMERTKDDAGATAKKLRRSEQYVLQRLLISEMPEYIQAHLKSGKLKIGVALALGQIDNETIREKWIELAVEQGISVKTAEFQLHDYRTNKQLYDGIIQENPDNGSPAPPLTVLFECAISGEKRDARLGRTIWISEDALPVFNEFVRLYRSPPAEIEPPTPANDHVATR